MKRVRKRFVVLLLLSLLAGICACGNSGSITPLPDQLTDGSFVLSEITDSQLAGSDSGSLGIKATDQGATTTVEISVAGASGLKALYYALDFDPNTYNPVSAVATGALGSNVQILEIYTVPAEGKLYHGQILAGTATKPGFSGSAVLARITFNHEAQPKLNQASSVVSRLTNKAPLTWDDDTQSLQWHYANQGDYNQDGIVDLTDLTPLGLQFGQAADGAQFAVDSLESQIDGNANGMLDVNDTSAIVAGWGQSVKGGYNIYASPHCESYPVYDVAPSTISPVANVPLAAALTAPTEQRLSFGYQVSDPLEGVMYWVRPVSGDGKEGISSDLLLGDPAAPGLWVANPPAISPKAPYVVEHGDTYTLMVDDPADGDVSAGAGTSYTVEPAQAATIAGNVLTVSSSYYGWFSVHATYNGKVVKPGSRDASQIEDNGGLGFYVPQPDSVFALPELTEVHAGGRVRVTAYAYESAHPLVHPVVTLEPGSHAKYVPDSFNLGSAGNDKYFADGLWAEIGATNFAAQPDNWIEEVGPFYQYRCMFGIAASDGSTVNNATGALFNFELQIMADSTIGIVKSDMLDRTWYSDGTQTGGKETQYFWAHCDNSDVPEITTYGELPQLSLRLDDPPQEGNGSRDNPYRLDSAAMDYTLTLLSDVFGDITINESTKYTVMPDIAGEVTIADGEANLELAADFSGSIQIRAEYGGISTDDENSLYLFLSGAPRDDYFRYPYVEDETYIFGGTVTDIDLDYENYVDTNDEGYQEEFLKVDIVATGASHLKALEYSVNVNADLLRFYKVLDNSAMDKENGLLTFPDQFYRDKYYQVYEPDEAYGVYRSYTFEYCQAMIRPQEVEGFSGDGVLVSFLFHKAPQPKMPDTEWITPSGPDNLSPGTFDPVTHQLTWYHYNVGDYNQDQYVGFFDLIPLAVHFGESVTDGENSIQAVVDGDHDGHVYLGDLAAIMDHWLTTSGNFYIYSGTLSQYPNQGIEGEGFYYTWSPSEPRGVCELEHGDRAAERVWYEYTVEDPQAGLGYWVGPNADLFGDKPFTEFIPGI